MYIEWASRNTQKSNTSRVKGFTIVELLIVVVVIAILAAITIVAYNGIQNRAKASATQSAVSQAVKKIGLYKVDNADQSPDAATFNTLVVSTNAATYQYTPGSNGAFCVTATTNNLSYFASNTQTTPALGTCSGHGANGATAITNLIPNPSVESDVAGWSLAINGSTASRSASAALFGNWGVTVTAPNTGNDSGVQVPVSILLTAGTTYTASVSIKAITAGTYSLSTQGIGGSAQRDIRTMTAGSTQRFSLTWSPTTSGATSFYALRQGAAAGAQTFYVDGAMLTTGAGIPAYADGETDGWVWNGTRYNSTSTGSPTYN